jgi:signal transduction histidine kinase
VPFTLGGTALLAFTCALAASAVAMFATLAVMFESLKVEALHSLEEANRALAQARDQAEAAMRAKGDFLASMSHEIRTPLHGIFGMTELALDTTSDDERREFIQRARGCTETLLAIINDILDFSRIEADKITLEHADFDLREVLDGVLDTLAVQAAHKGLELVGCVEDGVPARVRGDAGRLRQILINLGGNAVKFTERGEVVLELAVAGDGREPGTIRVRGTVRDTGVGIPSDKQAAIFEAFTQADSSTTRRYGGTGLGLAITQRLVTLMGGAVEVESTEGRGSAFRFTAEMTVVTPAPACTMTPLAGVRVLIVDESAAGRRHLLHLVRGWGCEATEAADLAAARARLATGDADLVLLSLGSAVGWQALVREPRPKGLPLFVALAGAAARAPQPGEATDLAAVVRKPVKAQALLQALAAVVAQLRRAGRPARDAAARPPRRETA